MASVSHILALGFITPWLMAAGAAATSIPIIIHLLNKRKFRIVVWAAMDWLLAAQRRNARRLRFQRLLLLAIRCLAILIIAAGIAQMVLQNTVLAAFGGEQRAVVIIWDDSYSMGYQQEAGAGGGMSAFERSRRLIGDYLATLNSGDKVMLIRASTGGAADTSAKPTSDKQAVLAQLASTRLSDAATDLPAAFDRARQVLADLEATTRGRQLLLLTDFSNSSIHDPKRGAGADNRIEGLDGERLRKAAQGAIAHATDFRVIPLGTREQSNLAVTGLTARQPAAVVGAPVDLDFELFNASAMPQLDVSVVITLDGLAQATVKVSRAEAGAFQTASARLTFPTVGRHLVEARLPGDLLPADDTRRLMVNVRKEIPVLLVDGSPGDGGRTSNDSTVYLAAAYSLPRDIASRPIFTTKVVTELEFPTTPITAYDAIILSDTLAPAPPMIESIKRYVEEGGLLILFPGNRTAASAINEAFGENGAKLLPATFGQLVKMDAADAAQRVTGGFKFAPEDYRHPVFAEWRKDIRDGKKVGIDLVQITQYLKLGVPADGSVETILRFAKPDGTPGDAAVVKKEVRKGKVVQFASTASADPSAQNSWNNFGAKPSFAPFIYELTLYTLGRDTLNAGAGLTLEVGSRIRLPAEIAAPGPWTISGGSREEQIWLTPSLKDGRTILESGELAVAGAGTPNSGDQRPVVAVNVEGREADIRPVDRAQMAAALGADIQSVSEQPILAAWSANSADAGHSWLGPRLLAAALGLFLLETILALAFSTYR